MRKIEAIIRKSKFREVKRSLIEGGFSTFNYHLTRSSFKSEHRYYRGVEYDAQAEERVQLSIYVKAKKINDVLDIIKSSGVTNDAQESLIGIFKPEKLYRLVDEDGTDKLIEVI